MRFSIGNLSSGEYTIYETYVILLSAIAICRLAKNTGGVGAGMAFIPISLV